MKQYILSLSIVLGMMLFASCSEEDRTTADLSKSMPYFEKSVLGFEVSEETGGSVTFDVARFNELGDPNVEVELILPEGVSSDVFSLASNKAVFKDDEFTTSLKLNFDLSKMTVPTVYELQVAIKTSPVFGTSIPLVININKEWVFDKELGKGVFTSDAFGFENKEVQLMGINGSENVYMIKDAYATGYPLQFALLDGGKDIIFQDQVIGLTHASYGSYFVRLADFKYDAETKTVHLWLYKLVSAGSFGIYEEIVKLP